MSKQLSFFGEPDRPKVKKPPAIPGWSDEEIELRERLERGESVVISERKRGPHQNLIAWVHQVGLHTYIGRRNTWTGHTQSIWHNPFRVTENRPSTIAQYREYLLSKPDLLSRLHELRGRALGCWCAPDYECHGDVLVELLNRKRSIKVLSIRQPWAWLICNAGKDVENRTWYMRHRGPLLIHAGKGCTRAEYEAAVEFCEERGLPTPPPLRELERGGIVGQATVVGCVERFSSPWFVGPHGIVLTDQAPRDFLPCKGQLGMWDMVLDS